MAGQLVACHGAAVSAEPDNGNPGAMPDRRRSKRTARWSDQTVPLLQIRRMISQQSSRDVSIGYFCVLLGGFALWLAYGAAIANLALIVPNAVAFGVGCLTVGVAVRYRPPRGGRQSGSPNEANVP